MVSNTTTTPLCDSLGCVHPHNEGLHGLLSRRGPSSVCSAPLTCPPSSCFFFYRLVLAKTLCHCHTLLFFTCSDDFLPLSVHRHLHRNVIRTAVRCDCVLFLTLLSCIARGRPHALLYLLLSSVFLLNADPSSLSFLLVAVHGLSAPGLVPRCRRVCLGGVFCSLTILVLQARLAPLPQLPVLGAFHALFLSSLPARDLQHITWRLRFCLLEFGIHCTWRLSCCLLVVGHQQNLDLVASHRLGHLCFSWHVLSRCSFLRNLDLKLFVTSTRSFQDVRISSERQIRLVLRTEITHSSCN